METKEETRATYSVTSKSGYNVLLTIPAKATEEEIKEMFANFDIVDDLLAVNGFAPQSKYGVVSSVKPAISTTPQTTDTKMCPIHNVTMTGKDGKYGKFYSHKDGEGWCNGKPKVKSY